MRSRFRRPSHATVVAYLALFVALGGTAAATHESIFSSDIVDNQVFSSDVRNDTLAGGGLAAADLRPSSVGQSEIASGAVGSSEIPDFALSNQDVGVLFAEVNSNGTLANSSGGVTSSGGSGFYTVDFGRDVSACTAVATISNNSENSGEVIVGDSGSNAVFVQIRSSAGGPEANAFHLVVVC